MSIQQIAVFKLN